MLLLSGVSVFSQENQYDIKKDMDSHFHIGIGYSNFLEAGMDVFPETGPDILKKTSALNHGLTLKLLRYNFSYSSAVEVELGYFKERYGDYVKPRFDKLTSLLGTVDHTFERDSKFTTQSTVLLKAGIKRWHYLPINKSRSLRVGYGLSLELLPEEEAPGSFLFDSVDDEDYVIECNYDHNWTTKMLNKGVYLGAGYQKYLWGHASFNFDIGYYFYPTPYTYGEYSTAGAFPFEATGTMIHDPGHFQIDVSVLF